VGSPKLNVPKYRAIQDTEGYYMLQFYQFGQWYFVDDAWTHDFEAAKIMWKDIIDFDSTPPILVN
jgi:hypothetical protein